MYTRLILDAMRDITRDYNLLRDELKQWNNPKRTVQLTGCLSQYHFDSTAYSESVADITPTAHLRTLASGMTSNSWTTTAHFRIHRPVTLLVFFYPPRTRKS